MRRFKARWRAKMTCIGSRG